MADRDSKTRGFYMQIKRDFYLQQLIDKKHNGRVKIITGIRRCGKSYLLFELFREHLLSRGVASDQILNIALDDLTHMSLKDPLKLNTYILSKCEDQSKQYYVCIDEVQLCLIIENPYVKKDYISFIDILLTIMKKPNIDVYVTGSNSKMLSSDILTQFRDRGDRIHVYPLSFAEIYHHNKEKGKLLQEYLTYGGMPHLQKLDSHEAKAQYLKELFDETYIKDIIERNNLKDKRVVLNMLLHFIASAIGSLTNPTRLANRFLSELNIKIHKETINNYLEHLKEAYIISDAHRYDVKGSRYFSTPLKYYFSDVGLRNSYLNFRQLEDNHIMENLIYNDLVRRGYNVDVGIVSAEIYKNNKRSKVQLEIDFVINRADTRYYIQSALTVSDHQKRLQETRSLKKVEDSFRKFVIVKDDIISHYDDDGIFYMGLMDFLLTDSLADIK